MTTTAEVLASYRMQNAEALVNAAATHGLELAFAAAIAHQETTSNVQVYGHDLGGTWSTADGPVVIDGAVYPQGSNIPVTPENYAVFYDLVVNQGQPTNGVGCMQITWAGEVVNGKRDGGYLRQARELGYDLATPGGNDMMGCWILAHHAKSAVWANISRENILRYAAVMFNQGNGSKPEPWPNQWYGVDIMGGTKLDGRVVEKGKLQLWRERLAFSLPAAEPVPEPTPPPAPEPAPEPPAEIFAAGNYVTTTDVNVRTGPGTDYAIFGVARGGTRVYATGVLSGEGKWAQIKWRYRRRTVRAWVSRAYLKKG